MNAAIPDTPRWASGEAEQVKPVAHTDEVLATLRETLAQYGYVVRRCELHRVDDDVPLREESWTIPVDSDHVLVLDVEMPGTKEPFVNIYPILRLARAHLAFLLAQQRQWQILRDVLARLEGAKTEQDVVQELAAGLSRLFDVSSVRIFRYRPETDGLSLEAAQDRANDVQHEVGTIFPLSALPRHGQALKYGQVVRVADISRGAAGQAEEARLFPSHVRQVVIVPFWLGTSSLGVISLGLDKGQDPSASPLLPILLRYVSLVVERIQQAARLRAAQAESQLMLEKAMAGMMILSADARVIQANSTAARTWGLEVRELLGRSAVDMFGEEIERLLAECRSGQGDAAGPREWHILSASGEQKEIILTGHLLPAADEREAPRYLLSFVDISAQKRAERLRRQMIANVTHEMRTPIAIIQGYAEMLQEMGAQVDPAFFDQALQIIQNRAKDLLYMVESYIDLSVQEAGEYSPMPEDVDIGGLIEALAQEYTQSRPNIPAVYVDVAPEARHIWADSHLFTHIVRHLLDNAIKFTPADGQVMIRAWAEDSTLHLVVSDTGVGIDPDDLPYVFDTFYRGQNAGFDVPGSGVGLSLVRSAVRYMGGEIHVESERHRQSVFHVILPDVVLPSPSHLRKRTGQHSPSA